MLANITWFNAYHAYADHLQFLNDLVTAHPSNAEIVVAGNSGSGRPITGIHFYGSGGKGSKPAVVIHGTVHAREWITTLVRILQCCFLQTPPNEDLNVDHGVFGIHLTIKLHLER
jgi:hypothetical protein